VDSVYSLCTLCVLCVLTLADVGVPDILLQMLVVERSASLTAVSCRVVLTLVTEPPAHVSRSHEHHLVEVTGVRVLVTVTLCNTTEEERTLRDQ